MTAAFCTSPRFYDHHTGPHHPERPDRLRAVLCAVREAGLVRSPNPLQALDTGIIRACWLSLDDIRAGKDKHRSPQVLTCVEHYLTGQRFPLSVLTHL